MKPSEWIEMKTIKVSNISCRFSNGLLIQEGTGQRRAHNKTYSLETVYYLMERQACSYSNSHAILMGQRALHIPIVRSR